MKVLITSELNKANSLIDGLFNRINKHVNTEISVDKFWHSENQSFDIIHLQWPEQLFQWRDINEKDIEALSARLQYWTSRGTHLVLTRHNILPHTNNGFYNEVYETIFKYISAIIHMSHTSVSNFEQMYGRKDYQIRHDVIYHPIYSDIQNNCTRQDARELLNIPEDKKVILVFGAIRSDDERKFTLQVFNKLQNKNKFLLVPSWFSTPPAKTKLFKRLMFELKAGLHVMNRSSEKRLLRQFVPDKDIQVFMNAADIVFLPRFEALNSGALIMAYTFNKIVVGPETGTIGELLVASNNPSFEVGNIEDATAKVEAALMLDEKKINNRLFAEEKMSWENIIEQHLELYSEVAQ